MDEMTISRPTVGGARGLVARLEHERRRWSRRTRPFSPTEQAWRAGIAEGLRLAQLTIRQAV